MEWIYCTSCGKKIPGDSRFCPECGEKILLAESFRQEQQQEEPWQEPESGYEAEPQNTNGYGYSDEQRHTDDAEYTEAPTGRLDYEDRPDFGYENGSAYENDSQEMKYCTNCGARIPADSRFCPECQAQQNVAPPKPEKKKTRKYVQADMKDIRQKTEAELKKRKKIIGIAVAAVVAVCLILGVVSMLLGSSINMNKYLKVTFSGYDTVGKAVITFDEERFCTENGKKLNKGANKGKGFSLKNRQEVAAANENAAREFLSQYVSVNVDKTENLTNGDTVNVTWTCDNAAIKAAYGLKVRCKDQQLTVSGLEKADVFDPFEGISVTFEGLDGNGDAEITGSATDPAAQEFRYSLDKSYDLSNGDTVTVTAYMSVDDPIEYCQTMYGKIPGTQTKTYTVSGLMQYVSTLSEISADALAQMQAQAQDVYQADVAQNWGDGESLQGMTYLGTYLLKNKNSDSWGSNNLLYLVYKVSVRDRYSGDEGSYDKTNDIYWYICYSNLLTDGQGMTQVDTSEYNTPGDRVTIESNLQDGWWSGPSWSYRGYDSLENLYKTVVTANLESYTHEDNVDAAGTAASQTTTPDTTTPDSTPASGNAQSADSTQTTSGDGQIFPDSSDTVLDTADIEALSDTDLRYAINELYARHGYIFKDSTLKAYYEQFSWYNGTVSADDFTSDMFNSVELKNIKALQKERKSRK